MRSAASGPNLGSAAKRLQGASTEIGPARRSMSSTVPRRTTTSLGPVTRGPGGRPNRNATSTRRYPCSWTRKASSVSI